VEVVHLKEAASVIHFALSLVIVATMSGWFAHVSVMKCIPMENII
jgi:hypothetical protein